MKAFEENKPQILHPRLGEFDVNGRQILSPIFVGHEALQILNKATVAYDVEIELIDFYEPDTE